MPTDVQMIARVDEMRRVLTEKEAQLSATEKGAAGRYDLMRDVYALRQQWRKAEAAIGRRAAGMSVNSDTRWNPVPAAETHKLDTLVRGYKKAAKRNTGRPISMDIAEFERRVEGAFRGKAIIG